MHSAGVCRCGSVVPSFDHEEERSTFGPPHKAYLDEGWSRTPTLFLYDPLLTSGLSSDDPTAGGMFP